MAWPLMPFGLTQSGNGIPRIERVAPAAAIAGGEVEIHGSGFASHNNTRPRVRFGEVEGELLLSAENFLIARVPECASERAMRVSTPRSQSATFSTSLRVR